MNFRQVPAYLEKVFSSAKQRIFSRSLRRKILGFLVFAVANMGDIKRDNLARKDFQKCIFAMVVLGMCQS